MKQPYLWRFLAAEVSHLATNEAAHKLHVRFRVLSIAAFHEPVPVTLAAGLALLLPTPHTAAHVRPGFRVRAVSQGVSEPLAAVAHGCMNAHGVTCRNAESPWPCNELPMHTHACLARGMHNMYLVIQHAHREILIARRGRTFRALRLVMPERSAQVAGLLRGRRAVGRHVAREPALEAPARHPQALHS